MTTFTKISGDEQPVIFINPAHKISKIDDNTYGGFTEHMGRCIYGGLYDPGNSLSDEHGYRKDVIECFQELNCPVVRYPGGNFIATYHWMDGIGPRENRPKKMDLAWHFTETNEFGTDEFLKWCEIVGTAPYLALNFGTGTLDEAMGWLEYCNGTGDSYYANLRRQNGREEPWKVKYWALGNECWGPWQVEEMTQEDYAKKAYQWAKALKLIDPSIQLILCGKEGPTHWDYYVTKECINYTMHALGNNDASCLIDMHSIHIYTASAEHNKNVTSPRSAERAIQVAAALIDLARVENKVPVHIPKQKICFDEWNVWDPQRAPGWLGAEEKYTLSDALAVGVWLNVFVRQSRYIGMATIAQSVNVISPLMTTTKGLLKQTTWWPLLLYSKYMRGWTLGVHLACAEYEGDTKPDWIRGCIETPWLDVSAAVADDGVVTLAVVNVHEERAFTTRIEGLPAGTDVEVFTVTGPTIDSVNTEDSQEVGVHESRWKATAEYDFPKASISMLRWSP